MILSAVVSFLVQRKTRSKVQLSYIIVSASMFCRHLDIAEWPGFVQQNVTQQPAFYPIMLYNRAIFKDSILLQFCEENMWYIIFYVKLFRIFCLIISEETLLLILSRLRRGSLTELAINQLFRYPGRPHLRHENGGRTLCNTQKYSGIQHAVG